MKIWFDLSNSPHVNMFCDLIKDLQNEDNEVIITSRPLANTIQLLDQKRLKHKIIGTHYGKNIFKKLYGFPIRIYQLNKYLKSKGKIDIAVSQSSFHSPVSAWLLGIPSIYTNDNEYAIGNKAAFLFASKIFLPEDVNIQSRFIRSFFSVKTYKYPGLKEGIYLWRMAEKINLFRKTVTNPKKIIFFRPEPQTAQYYNGKLNFLDNTIISLQNDFEFVVLPRNPCQYDHYKNKKFHSIKVADKPIDIIDIAKESLLFIGAGGSMTRELALLGVPTISVYQDDLLKVDKIIISKGLMIHEPELTPEILKRFVETISNRQMPDEFIKKGKSAYELFKQTILNYNNG